MTDPNRRSSDPRIDEILENQKTHVADFHAIDKDEIMRRVKVQDTLVADMALGREDIGRILTVIEGTPEINAHGETIGYSGGMRETIGAIRISVTELNHRGNGGGGFSIRRKDKWQSFWIGVTASIITAAGFVLAAWIG